MKGHNIWLYEEIWKIVPKLSLISHLIWNTDLFTVGSCIYHPTMLGLPDYQKRRMQLNDEIGEHKGIYHKCLQ